MKAIIRKHKQRADAGKLSVFRIRGKEINLSEVKRYLGRSRFSFDNVITQRPPSPTPPAGRMLDTNQLSNSQKRPGRELHNGAIFNYNTTSTEKAGDYLPMLPSLYSWLFRCAHLAYYQIRRHIQHKSRPKHSAPYELHDRQSRLRDGVG